MDDIKADLELEAIEGLESIEELDDRVAPMLAANHNETLVRDLED